MSFSSAVPTINFTSPTLGSGTFSTHNNIMINVTANDTVLSNITINLYNSANSLINSTTISSSPNFVNITGLADGLYFFNATATNSSRISNSTATRNVTIDTTPPVITVTSPTVQTYTNHNVTISFSGSDSSGISTQWYYNGSSNVTYTTATSLLLADGHYNFTFYANDSLGNLNSASISFSVDTTPPQVTINAPGNNTYTSSSTPVNITINEAGNCLYTLNNGSSNYSMSTNDNLNFTANTPVINDGNYILIAYCTDSFGNQNNSNVNVSFSINTSSSGSSNSGSSGSSSQTWSTVSISDSQFSDGYNAILNALDRISVNVENEVHYIGINQVNSDNVLINVSSNEQDATLYAGQSQEFDVTGDNYYDIRVILNSISGSTVNVTVMSVHDPIVNNEGSLSTTSSGSDQSQNITGNQSSTSSSSGSTSLIMLALIVFVILAAAGGIAFLLFNKKKNVQAQNQI